MVLLLTWPPVGLSRPYDTSGGQAAERVVRRQGSLGCRKPSLNSAFRFRCSRDPPNRPANTVVWLVALCAASSDSIASGSASAATSCSTAQNVRLRMVSTQKIGRTDGADNARLPFHSRKLKTTRSKSATDAYARAKLGSQKTRNLEWCPG